MLPPSPPGKQKKVCFRFPLFISPLSICWINHFTPVINKRTNGWMSLPSDYWFTNRRDVYFLRENYTEHFNYVDFLFFVLLFCLFGSSLSPAFLDCFVFFASRGRFPLRLYWSPPNATPQTPHTGAIKHWSLEKTTHKHTHTHKHLCYYTSRARSLPLVQTSSTEMLSTPQVLLGVLHLSELSKVFKPLWYATINTDHHEFLIHNKNTPFIFYIIWTFWCTVFM